MAYIQEYVHGKKLSEFISTNFIFLHFDINLAIFLWVAMHSVSFILNSYNLQNTC